MARITFEPFFVKGIVASDPTIGVLKMSLAVRKSLKYVPDDIEFYPHQIEGIRLLANKTNFLLADEMGLGKSAQALTVFAIDVERGYARRCLIVCTATLKANWEEEVDKFTFFRARVLEGTLKQRQKHLEEFGRSTDDILIVNYEQVVGHLAELNALNFDVVIYDEAHAMKNPRAKRTKACHGLSAKRYFLLTGSPMLNRVDELWSLLYRIAPADFPKYWAFLNRYAVFGGYESKQIVGVKNEKELTAKLQNVMVRRLKKDVLDLPEKQRIVVTVMLNADQKKLYDEITDEMQMTMPDNPTPVDIENALTKFLRLKQVCGTTACFPGFEDSSFKLDRLVEDAKEIMENGHKVVIFTQFRGVLAAIEQRLAASYPTYSLSGATPVNDRVPTVNRWAATSGGAAIVCMLQVAGVGLNMTAARHALFADKLFVPKLNEQAEDRLHRIGADKSQPVQIREYICKGTIESRIESILRSKSRLFGTIVEQSEFKKALYRALTEEDE
jgi:SNF2 family DNA or RNA helicase